MADDGETETQAAVFSGAAAIGLAKTVEDVRQKIRRDAHAGIAHCDFDVITGVL